MGDRLCALLLAAAMSLGCGTINVESVKPFIGKDRSRPTRIIIYDFETDAADIRLSDDDASKAAAGVAVAGGLSQVLLDELKDIGIPTSHQTGELIVPDGALAISGKLMKVDEGSGFKRGLVGFGYGASEVDTIAQIYGPTDMSPELLGEYRTHATSGRKPGILTTLPIGVAVQGFSLVVVAISAASITLGELSASVSRDAARTGEEWADLLKALFEERGWIED